MAFLHLFVVNKSGGLIYHRPLSAKAPKININEWLRIGSTFHSLHAIASEASPTKLPNGKNSSGADDGIEEIVAGNLILKCLQTRTGIKFVVTAERLTNTTAPSSSISDSLNVALRDIYKLYVDCVLKDPFYELEMPIRSELFVQAVNALMERLDNQHPSGNHKSSSTSVGYNSSNHGGSGGGGGLRQR